MFSSVQEADYEIASYARQHGSLGILGQDSDFIIYDRFVQIIMFYFETVLDVMKFVIFTFAFNASELLTSLLTVKMTNLMTLCL